MKKIILLQAFIALFSMVTTADILVDDFENGLGGTRAQSAIGERYSYYYSNDSTSVWYAYNEEAEGGNSTMNPNYLEDKDFSETLVECESNDYLAVIFNLGDGLDKYETAYAGIGVGLTYEGESVNLEDLKAVEFYAFGEGTMTVKMITDVSSSYEWGDMAAAFDLPETWKKIVIPADDIEPDPWSVTSDSGVTWDDCKYAVTKLHFQTNGDAHKAGETVKFAIDNIKLSGVDDTEFGFLFSQKYTEDFIVNGDVELEGTEDTKSCPNPFLSAAIEEKAVVTTVNLSDAYPNPFNPTTTINFALPQAEQVSLKIYDAKGSLVKTLYNGVSASQSLNWNATNTGGEKVASGVYFYKLTSKSKVITKKMVLLK